MNRQFFVVAGSMGVLVLLFAMLSRPAQPPRPTSAANGETVQGKSAMKPLLLFCAASNRAVIEQVRTDYEAETGRTVQVQYGSSQALLSSIEVGQTGDLFLPADDSFLDIARAKKLAAESIPLASMNIVVAVRKGNPRTIRSLDDLLRTDVRLVQGSPDSTAVGKLTRETLQAANQWEPLEKATTAFRTTVTDVANDLAVGAADAGIVYSPVLQSYQDLEGIVIEELRNASSGLSIAVLKSANEPASALHFARYVAAADRGLKRYAEHNFRVESGDAWSDVPELKLFAGSMLRPAIDDTLVAFEQREGIRISRVYNGCGILVAQMKAGQHPDAYFACDREFMTQVPDLFPSPVDVAQNELVILVKKGNPRQIASLKDLGRSGLRVGIGHEKQCAMGWLTQNTLKEGGVQQEVMQNVTVQTPTGDMLVNQLLAGSLDAAVVYLSNAAGAGEKLDAIQIQGLECAVAVQPFAISNETRFPRLTARLFEQLRSADSQAIFEAEGFGWKSGTAATP